jgi:hypothetical protein
MTTQTDTKIIQHKLLKLGRSSRSTSSLCDTSTSIPPHILRTQLRGPRPVKAPAGRIGQRRNRQEKRWLAAGCRSSIRSRLRLPGAMRDGTHVQRSDYNSSSRYLYTNLKSALRRFILSGKMVSTCGPARETRG